MRYFFIFSLMIFIAPRSFAETGKEFTTSVIYGTLAGTLVGAATLAFTSNPGDNLNNVARGASYGLYAGILLGLYVTYGVDEDELVEGEQGPSGDPLIDRPSDSENPTLQIPRKLREDHRLAFSPFISFNQIGFQLRF